MEGNAYQNQTTAGLVNTSALRRAETTLQGLQVRSQKAGMSPRCICTEGGYVCPLCEVRAKLSRLHRRRDHLRRQAEIQEAKDLRIRLLAGPIFLGQVT